MAFTLKSNYGTTVKAGSVSENGYKIKMNSYDMGEAMKLLNEDEARDLRDDLNDFLEEE